MVSVKTDLGTLRESARRIRVEEDGAIVQNNVQKALETLDTSISTIQGELTSRVQRSITSSASLPILTTDAVLNVTVTTALTIPVPASTSMNGDPLLFQDLSGNWATNNIVFNRTGSDTFDGATTITASLNYGWIELRPMNDGVNTGYKIRGIYQ